LAYSSIAMPLDCWSKMLISTFRTLPFFHSLKKALPLSDNVGAEDPGIP
jgi:hypothetical protein